MDAGASEFNDVWARSPPQLQTKVLGLCQHVKARRCDIIEEEYAFIIVLPHLIAGASI